MRVSASCESATCLTRDGKPHALPCICGRPFPALVAALTFIVGWKHFNDGAQVLIEDYVHGASQKLALILVTCLSYAAMATGLFAIAKIAL